MITTIFELGDSQSLTFDMIMCDLVPMSYAFIHVPAAICPSGN